jgi:selenium-binding protein 1
VPAEVGRCCEKELLLVPSLALACRSAVGRRVKTTPPAATGAPGRFLYTATIAQSPSDPDFVAVIGADPRRSDFGKIVNRVDMPNVGDELHHFGYSADQRRLVVPGLFSNRIHVFEIGRDGRRMRLRAVNEEVTSRSGYITPHSVVAKSRGRSIITMIGAATDTTQPGHRRDQRLHRSVHRHFARSERLSDDLGRSTCDFDSLRKRTAASARPSASRGLRAGIDPSCLGDGVSVWDLNRRKVIQVEPRPEQRRPEVRFLEKHGARRAFINTPGTHAVWLAHDDDGDGVFAFVPVLGPEHGLAIPVDMLLSHDQRFLYLSNWFANTVQQFDVTDPLHPVLTAEVSLPHPNMLRLSPDDRRLYVSNSLLSTWDNDPDFGPPRNNDYGIWLFDVDTHTGRLTSIKEDGSAWVSFTNVRKKTTTGPAGPHMMFFDPSIRVELGEH